MSDSKEQKPNAETTRPQTPSSAPSTVSDPGKGKYQDPSRFTTNQESKIKWGDGKTGGTDGEP